MAPQSIWQVGSIEPGVDLDDGAPGTGRAAAADVETSVPWGAAARAVLFSRYGAAARRAAGADRRLRARTTSPAGIELAITVVPREPGVTVSFVLPDGVIPARSSLPGVRCGSGRWTAIYVAPPPEGVAFRASFTGVTAERLRETRVAVTSARLPAAAAGSASRAGCPRTAWSGPPGPPGSFPTPPRLSPCPHYVKLRSRYGIWRNGVGSNCS